MPKSPRVVVKTLSRDEQRFIGYWVKESANPERMSYCERRAGIKAGTGDRMLKRAHVADEIKRRMVPAALEQERQRLVSEAVAAVISELEKRTARAEADAKAAEAEVTALAEAPKMAVNTPQLEHELMRLAVHLDIERHPQVKLAAIQAAFVVSGVLENGNVRRVQPKEPGDASFQNAIYGDLFDEMHRQREMAGQPPKMIEAQAEPQVFDLIPHDPVPENLDIPPEGETIENIAGEPDPETADPEPSKRPLRKPAVPKVMTVDLG